jgi:ATP-dependent RNA helicase SUPV3L1/SUV3
MPLHALLGPTNTGKTHRAVERMLEHPSGMIGLPLRLLAREVYDRVSARIGEQQVALVTGEEKRVPKRPRYWVCTVEAMPLAREVDFVAVDEVQLAAHRQRGHVFTDRLLHARGVRETWFMGSDTMEPLVRQLVPTALIQRHPRFSTLRSAGALGLSALPARTAVVAFSAPQVYELAERIRRKRGGAAVVLGALSPRTRNAQVALYQSGEVQYMVATDAIGMGLNMDVDLVAFAGLQKFDGREARLLEPAELAQIAGRAGRHHRDGSFASLRPVPPLPEAVQRAIETHRFAPVRQLMWRNSELDTSSLDGLLESLKLRPTLPCLRLVEQADDFAALQLLSARASVRSRVRGPEAVSLLWQVCQIPDFRQLMPEVHASLLEEIFEQLASHDHRIDPQWLEPRIARLDDDTGDLDTLMSRIAFIRTWTYVANHAAWVQDAAYWQGRTREVEDRLSDALHERLVQRFVSRRADARGVRRAPGRMPRAAEPEQPATDAFHAPFQALRGLKLPSRSQLSEPRTLDMWVQELVEAPHERFHVDAEGRLWDGEERVARMIPGVDRLHPQVMLQLDDDPGAGARLRIARRLLAWTRDMVSHLLAPLRRVPPQELTPPARGIVYQLEHGLGIATTDAAREQLRALAPRDHKLLRAMDVRVGRRLLWVQSLLEPQMVLQRAALCSAWFGAPVRVPRAGVLSLRADQQPQVSFALGYPVFGGRALRADLAERIEAAIGREASQGPWVPSQQLVSLLGCDDAELAAVLEAFGCRRQPDGAYEARTVRRRRKRRFNTTAAPGSQSR